MPEVHSSYFIGIGPDLTSLDRSQWEAIFTYSRRGRSTRHGPNLVLQIADRNVLNSQIWCARSSRSSTVNECKTGKKQNM